MEPMREPQSVLELMRDTCAHWEAELASGGARLARETLLEEMRILISRYPEADYPTREVIEGEVRGLIQRYRQVRLQAPADPAHEPVPVAAVEMPEVEWPGGEDITPPVPEETPPAVAEAASSEEAERALDAQAEMARRKGEFWLAEARLLAELARLDQGLRQRYADLGEQVAALAEGGRLNEVAYDPRVQEALEQVREVAAAIRRVSAERRANQARHADAE